MKILVTGGAGFIGSHVTDRMIKLGHEVHVIDDLYSGNVNQVNRRAQLHIFDVRNKYQVRSLFSKVKFDVIFHKAAQMSVIRSVNRPIMDASINIIGTLNILEAAQHVGVGKFIFASSGGVVYGNPNVVPQDEEHNLSPISPYGISKVVCEQYLQYFWDNYNFPFIALRYSNVYGPRQNSRSGAGVIGIFMEKILTGEQPYIYGSGNKTRDYIYISDVVEANVRALEYNGVGAFNIGTGVETDVNTIFRLIIEQLSRSDIPEIHKGEEAGEQFRSVLDISKSCEILRWEPKVSFRVGLEETVDWYLSTYNDK